ncbi:MAG: WecB/TagA/CpsF family glycosyltransferase, partial [bacterium]|nr:WecB/TagA/CpsF family glycosyltransferase [bacterium]
YFKKDFKKYKKYILIFPDGIGFILKLKLNGKKVKEKIAGVELVDDILKNSNKYNLNIYLFGSQNEVLEKLIDKYKKEYKTNIVGYQHGYTDNLESVIEDINNKNTHILLVGLGSPKQEEFIFKNFNKIKSNIIINVGGSFDVLSGYKKRAPKLFIKLKLEWLYRMIKEPKRFKKIFKLIAFLFKDMEYLF